LGPEGKPGSLRPLLNALAFRDGVLLIPLTALAALLPRLRGVSCGDDFDFHLMGWMEAQRSWTQGVLFPHWVQSANWGAGEPRFVFYPPLSWMAGALLGFVLPWNWVGTAFIFLALTGTGLATRALARQFLPAPNATLAGILAAATPYAFFVAYHRSALSELAAAAWIPLLLLYALKPQVGSEGASAFDRIPAVVPYLDGESSTGQPIKSLAELSGNIEAAERRYDRLGQSNYIAADRVKELLEGWADKANRPVLEEREHADASKIAYELFYRKAARLPKGSAVNLVTGPVAAGKTTAIGNGGDLTYEVNLSNKEKAFEHLDKLLVMALKPTVHYIHITPELSAERRALRAQKDGRAVRIDRSTAQHLWLPQTMQAVARQYGDRVPINVLDTSKNPARSMPVSEVVLLAYTGTEEQLLEQQQRHLDALRDSGAISYELHSQLSIGTSEIRGRVGEGSSGSAEQDRGAGGRGESGPRIAPALANPRIPSLSSLIPLALVLASAWLTNAPTGVMSSYLLAFAALSAAILQRKWEPILRAAVAAPLGLGLAAFYLVPAAWEQRWIAVQQALDVGMRIQDSWLFARHADPSLALHDRVLAVASTLVVFTSALTLGSFAIALRRGKLTLATRHYWLSLAIVAAALFLLQLPFSAPLWRALPKLQFLQFPWRWLAVLGVPYAIFLAAATPLGTRRARIGSSAAWAAVLLGFAIASSQLFFEPCDDEDNVPAQVSDFQTGAGVLGTDEYAAPGSDNSLLASGLPDACLVSDPQQELGEIDKDSGDIPFWYLEQGSCDATFAAELNQTERKRFQIDTGDGGFLVLRLRRYPAWEITINGSPVSGQGTREDGLIALPVAAGHSTVNIRWSTTPDVVWGRRISLASAMLLFLLWIAAHRRKPIRLSS